MWRKYVVHCKYDKYDVYIGRPSDWGNPYSHEKDTLARYKVKDRREAIEKYREWLLNNLEMMARLPELKGKILGCWCRPHNICHGDVLAELANK